MAPLEFLRWFCKPEYLVDVEGDLLEIYEKRVKRSGIRKARLLLWRDVILLFRPGMIRSFVDDRPYNAAGVIRHNIVLSFRNFWRHRTSFFINLGGLAVGLTCALLIYTWVADEISIDRFHEKKGRIYKAKLNFQSTTGIRTIEYAPVPLAPAMASELPEVESAVGVNPFVDIFGGPGIISYNKKEVLAQGLFAGDDFFKVFSFTKLSGDNRGVMISKGLARKLFDHESEAIGKVVDWTHTLNLNGPFLITGVFDDVPANSTMKFEVIFRIEKMVEGDSNSNEWNGGYAQTFLLLREGTDVDAFERKIRRFVIDKAPNTTGILSLTRFSDEYLYEEGRIRYVRLFSLVAIFTLAIACINFVNLSTAQASRKMKEVGVKKAIGVSRSTLVAQFLTESVILTLLSLLIAVALRFLLLPNFNQLTGKHLDFDFDPRLVVFVILVGILAGSYPAFFVSAFKPATILKGRIFSSSIGEIFTRKGLVVLQFTISIVFIIAFMIVNRQIDMLQNRPLGYSKENVIRFERKGRIDFSTFESFFDEIRNIPGVVTVSGTYGSILDRERALHNGFSWDGAPADATNLLVPSPYVAHDYIETLGIELKEGRTFSKDRADEQTKIIINESAAKMMGFEDPIGRLVHWGTDRLEIIGVVKDFQYGSLHTALGPVFFLYGSYRRDVILRLQPGFDQNTLDQLQSVYQKFHPGYPFEFTFLSDDYNRLYASEDRVSIWSTSFAIVATLISCLGLFGLAVFSSERRTKEIGIRKVLGATRMGIVRLLASDIVKPVFISILVAVPVSYFISVNWLSGFAYRIELSWWFFAAASVLALVVTWITVGLQTFKVAKANPVESLKAE
jgi:hypothetical protein